MALLLVSFIDIHGYVLLFLCIALGRHLDEYQSIKAVDEIISRLLLSTSAGAQVAKMVTIYGRHRRDVGRTQEAIWLRAITHHQKDRC